MKTYESSTTTLRAILAHSSLKRENIDRTMDALAEANQDAREVDNAIRIGGDMALGPEMADEEFEEEWKALVKEVEISPGVTQSLEQLQPAVPLKTSDIVEKVPLLSH